MPEIVFTYYSNFESKKDLKPFYNLLSESFLSLFSFSFLYINHAWSQASALLRTSIEQVSKIVVLTSNVDLLNDFIELYEARLAQECEIYYKKGFRFAYRLMIECFNDKF
jgi:hypothetical protein